MLRLCAKELFHYTFVQWGDGVAAVPCLFSGGTMQCSDRFASYLKSTLVTLIILLGSILTGFAFDALGLLEINIYTVFILGILVTAVITSSVFFGVLSSE